MTERQPTARFGAPALHSRSVVAALLAVIVAGVCVRLGLWQLDRLAERRGQGSLTMARLSSPPVKPLDLPATPAAARYRRVRVSGTFDFDHEIVLSGRTRQGAPGVHLLTPLRMTGGEDGEATGAPHAILVNRGWVYSPDASFVERGRWMEPERATLDAYVEVFPPSGNMDPRSLNDSRVWRRLDRERLAAALPYRLAPYYLVALEQSAPGGGARTPVRLPLPLVDEGPHKSYAIQWFSFAIIAIVGVAALIARDVRRM